MYATYSFRCLLPLLGLGDAIGVTHRTGLPQPLHEVGLWVTESLLETCQLLSRGAYCDRGTHERLLALISFLLEVEVVEDGLLALGLGERLEGD